MNASGLAGKQDGRLLLSRKAAKKGLAHAVIRVEVIVCVEIKSPSECSEMELHNFYSLVLKGCQVEPRGLMNRIKAAKLLGFHRERNSLVGVVGLKCPDESYKKDVFLKAGAQDMSGAYNLEIGWAYTEEEHRGKGICPGLIRKTFDMTGFKGVYATVDTKNASIARVLQKLGFRKTGNPYPGRKKGSFIQLFAVADAHWHK